MRNVLKIAYLLFSILLGATFVWAQQPITATTEDGRKILIYPDGTWRLFKETGAEPSSGTFEKSSNATLFVKTTSGTFGVWMDPQKWAQSPAPANEPKLLFTHKSGNAYAMVISESMEMPLDMVKTAAIANAKAAMPDLNIASEEKRSVSGKEVLCLKFFGTLRTIPITYYGYFYGGPEGTVQVITYAGTNLFEKAKPDLDEFLNGLQIGESH
jgi:hypothetical protein